MGRKNDEREGWTDGGREGESDEGECKNEKMNQSM